VNDHPKEAIELGLAESRLKPDNDDGKIPGCIHDTSASSTDVDCDAGYQDPEDIFD
jgi:hypothetical protein